MKRVVVESPYAGNTKLNEIYGDFCMKDCFVNYNESPYASHLLYTRKYVLDDSKPEERKLGIKAGFQWRDVAEQTNFYIDLGMTRGMQEGIHDCAVKQNPYKLRRLPTDLWKYFLEVCKQEGLEIPERSE